MAQTQHAPLIAFLEAEQQLPALSQVALRVAVTYAKWTVRHKTRSHLRTLDDHLLRDVGLDRRTAESESRRKFWQG